VVIISKYRLEKDKKGRYHVRSDENQIACPICGEILFVIGTRKRRVKDITGVMLTLIIRRLRCKGECKAIHHELPDMIVPYKRHCVETLEKIVGGEAVYCEVNTIRRISAWWATCLLYFKSVLASLREKYGTAFSSKPTPREIVRALVNAHLWVHTRSVSLPS